MPHNVPHRSEKVSESCESGRYSSRRLYLAEERKWTGTDEKWVCLRNLSCFSQPTTTTTDYEKQHHHRNHQFLLFCNPTAVCSHCWSPRRKKSCFLLPSYLVLHGCRWRSSSTLLLFSPGLVLTALKSVCVLIHTFCPFPLSDFHLHKARCPLETRQ